MKQKKMYENLDDLPKKEQEKLIKCFKPFKTYLADYNKREEDIKKRYDLEELNCTIDELYFTKDGESYYAEEWDENEIARFSDDVDYNLGKDFERAYLTIMNFFKEYYSNRIIADLKKIGWEYQIWEEEQMTFKKGKWTMNAYIPVTEPDECTFTQ